MVSWTNQRWYLRFRYSMKQSGLAVLRLGHPLKIHGMESGIDWTKVFYKLSIQMLLNVSIPPRHHCRRWHGCIGHARWRHTLRGFNIRSLPAARSPQPKPTPDSLCWGWHLSGFGLRLLQTWCQSWSAHWLCKAHSRRRSQHKPNALYHAGKCPSPLRNENDTSEMKWKYSLGLMRSPALLAPYGCLILSLNDLLSSITPI